ncbi:MAG: hypothetical protein KBD24_00075 [Candidatus Pacebacteria bacterium]|nr:hypothetical protein [Candidatus Paceibacterota bacterium]
MSRAIQITPVEVGDATRTHRGLLDIVIDPTRRLIGADIDIVVEGEVTVPRVGLDPAMTVRLRTGVLRLIIPLILLILLQHEEKVERIVRVPTGELIRRDEGARNAPAVGIRTGVVGEMLHVIEPRGTVTVELERLVVSRHAEVKQCVAGGGGIRTWHYEISFLVAFGFL